MAIAGSGWTKAMEKSTISTTDRIEFFLSGKKAKLTRYAHHVSFTVSLQLAEKAFKEQKEFKDFDAWKEHKPKRMKIYAFGFMLWSWRICFFN